MARVNTDRVNGCELGLPVSNVSTCNPASTCLVFSSDADNRVNSQVSMRVNPDGKPYTRAIRLVKPSVIITRVNSESGKRVNSQLPETREPATLTRLQRDTDIVSVSLDISPFSASNNTTVRAVVNGSEMLYTGNTVVTDKGNRLLGLVCARVKTLTDKGMPESPTGVMFHIGSSLLTVVTR